jgi:hypothetical protein
MGDVGDVDENLEVAVGQDAVGERVVEVLRVVRVDGQGENLAEILAPGDLAGGMSAAMSAASCSTFSGNEVGRSCLRMIERDRRRARRARRALR